MLGLTMESFIAIIEIIGEVIHWEMLPLDIPQANPVWGILLPSMIKQSLLYAF